MKNIAMIEILKDNVIFMCGKCNTVFELYEMNDVICSNCGNGS